MSQPRDPSGTHEGCPNAWLTEISASLEEITRLTRACAEAAADMNTSALEEAQRARGEAIERLGALGGPPGPLPLEVKEALRAAIGDVIAVDTQARAEIQATLEAVEKLLEGFSRGGAIKGYSPDEVPEPRFFDRKT